MDKCVRKREDWRQIYLNRLSSAEDAIKEIHDGDRVLVAGVCGRPEHLVRTLVDHADDYRNVKIMHGLSYGPADYCKPEYAENFEHEALFLSSATRAAAEEGRVKYYPGHYSELGVWFKEGVVPVNVFMLQVTPPDRYGYCSSGTIADFVQEAIDAADVVIAQVNKRIPWCGSPDCLVHVSRIDKLVEQNEPLPTLPEAPPITEVERQIGRYCASLVNDGDTIQVGIGSLPDAVCEALSDKKDLGVHSEMIGDGVLKLWKKGVITGKYKSEDRGNIVTTFILGSQELYDFVDHNACVIIRSATETNSPFEISKQHNMVSMNTCIEMDIMGQVVSGSSGERLISGAGGQADFVRGTLLSRDGHGKSIIAMTSTHMRKGQRYSRIKPHISDGSMVTVGREDIGYAITEYGIAHLEGKNLKDRARAMIGIAHPDYRPELVEAFEKRFKIKYEPLEPETV